MRVCPEDRITFSCWTTSASTAKYKINVHINDPELLILNYILLLRKGNIEHIYRGFSSASIKTMVGIQLPRNLGNSEYFI